MSICHTELTLEIAGQEIDMQVNIEYSVSGKHYPATLTDPEEFPELTIESIQLDPDTKKELQALIDGDIDIDSDIINEVVEDELKAEDENRQEALADAQRERLFGER